MAVHAQYRAIPLTDVTWGDKAMGRHNLHLLCRSLAKCGRLGLMFPKRLVVYDATLAKSATDKLKRRCRCRCRSRIRELCAWILANKSRIRGLCTRTLATSHWMSKTPLLTMLKLSNNVSYLKTIKFNHFAPLQFKCLVQRHISQREKKTHLGKYFQHANVT